MQIKAGNFIKINPGRGYPTNEMFLVVEVNPNTREATFVRLGSKQRITMYLAHLYTDMECHRAAQQWRIERASKIGTKNR